MKALRRWWHAAKPSSLPLGEVIGHRSLRWSMAGGALAVALSLCLSRPEYLPLARESANAVAEQEGIRRAPRTSTLRVPFVPMEARGRLEPVQSGIRDQTVRQAIAVNILLRSGFLESFEYAVDQETGLWIFSSGVDSRWASCAEGGPSISRMTLAVVALEKFNRNAIQRRLEWWYARSVLLASGSLPDISLGPAQIRPATVRRLAREASGARKPGTATEGSTGLADYDDSGKKDDELLDDLMNECQALRIASLVLERLVAIHGDDDAAALRAYAGHRRSTDAVIDYVPVVNEMLTILR